MREYLLASPMGGKDSKMPTIGRAFVATMSIFGILLLNGCNSKRRDLLCKADLNAIMQASTEVLAKASAGEIMTGTHEFRRTPQSPEIAKFPQVIRELQPTRVVIEDGYLTIQFGGGFDHFGLKVYAKDFKAPFAEFNYGSRQIIDGLWYYDEYYSDESTMHKRKIDRWIEARVRALGGKRGR